MRTVEQLRDAAFEALAVMHDDPKALDRLRVLAAEALRIAPDDPDAALINAWRIVREGLRAPARSMEDREAHYVAAASEFKRAIELGLASYSGAPILALIALFKTWHYFQAGDEQGPVVCRALLAMDGMGKASRHYQKAVVLSMYGRDDQSTLTLAELDSALALERHWASLSFRARIRKRLGDAEGARKDEGEACLLKPENTGNLK